MPGNHNEIEKRLWDAADELRADPALKSSESSVRVMALTLLRYSDQGKDRSRRFKIQRAVAQRSLGSHKSIDLSHNVPRFL